ncbi:DUF692 domain-containing protein [Cyanobacterium aponinum UTEX 3221]|uniref:DUF692 domain-containing protein n=1 Tax=Cyanobacterium aponinum TaxID=379064 RepID=UPI002B4C0C23|nr:DUF692 domain-containing protein [Cyanobacterium aponinum]WRL38442.1 DUF692 domain-containing protein [Cyanobacterium aponinum UTEX 3221]
MNGINSKEIELVGFGLNSRSAGLNLCHENADEFVATMPSVDFVQVHPEHFLQDLGGNYVHAFEKLKENYPLTFHGFGLSLGSIAPLPENYLKLVKRLLAENEGSFFSEHFSWSSVSHHHFHDLIPFPFTQEVLDYFCERVEQVQEYLGSEILLENISSYMRFSISEMDEIAFMNEVFKRTGAKMLLDLNNLWANAQNFEEDALERMMAIKPEYVQSYHLAGCTAWGDNNYIDYHGEAVRDEVWQLYQKAMEVFGAKPTLIEWENNIPPISRTVEEVHKAKAILVKA